MSESAPSTEAALESATEQQAQEAPVQSVEDLPEWAREKLSKANAQAAKYRTEKNDAIAAATAKITDEFSEKLSESEGKYAELQSQYRAKQVELAKLKAVLDAGIPGSTAVEVAGLVHGASDEEITAHVATVKELLAKSVVKDRPVDFSQGSGSPLPLNGDPVLDALKRVVNR